MQHYLLRTLLGNLFRVIASLVLCAMAHRSHAALSLTHYTFSVDNMPRIVAEQSDIVAIQSIIGPGGYYKLRAKILVTYDPGYFHAIDSANNNWAQLTHSPGPGNYVVQLYYVAYTASGSLTLGTFYSKPITITGGPNSANIGLQAKYFNNATLAGVPNTAVNPEAPNGAWASAGPVGVGVGYDYFSVRWEGKIDISGPGTYTFTTGSDDGMRVFIGDMNSPVAGAWWDHAYFETSGTKTLAPDQRYDIKVEFFENTGDATAKLFWQPPNGQKQIIPLTRFVPPNALNPVPSPPAVLANPGGADIAAGMPVTFMAAGSGYPEPSYQWRKNGVNIAGATASTYTIVSAQPQDAGQYDAVLMNTSGSVVTTGAILAVNPTAAPGTGTGLRGAYYSGMNFENLLTSRIDNNIDFYWGHNSPASGVPADFFSVRWFGSIEARTSGSHTFQVDADDAMMIFVNGVKILDWGPYVGTHTSQSIYLPAGVKVPIEVRYREHQYNATAKLYWGYPAAPTQVPVPREQLYPGTMTESSWQEFYTQPGVFGYWENTDEEGNGNGTYDSNPSYHPFVLLDGGGKLRVWTTGSAGDAHLYGGSSVQYLGTTNGVSEYHVGPGSYGVWVYPGGYGGNMTEFFTLHMEFKLDAGPPAAGLPPQITSDPSAFGTVGTAFAGYTITATGGTPMVYYGSNLPQGITINSSTGAVGGTPTVAGNYPNVVVYASNAAGTATKVVAMSISGASGAPIITSPSSVIAEVGVAFEYTIVATGTGLTFSVTGLPAGLVFDAAARKIYGTPEVSGNATVAITVTSPAGVGTASLSIVVGVDPTGLDVIRP